MHSLIRYSLAATAVLSMAGGVSARPSAPREGQLGQQNRIERPAAVGGGGGGGAEAKVANAKALYFLTNDEDNAIAAIELGDNGLVTGKGATYQTGGKGANGIDGATNEKAAPDALFSQSALTVAGKHIFAVNAGSNTLSMFAIDPNNPLALQKVGEDIQLPGEFPNTVAASEKNGLVCVGMTGQKAGVACADFSAEGGLGQADGLREFQLNQTTPPVGPTNTVSQVFWSADESQLLATVKGDPEKGNNGFFSAYAQQQQEGGNQADQAKAGKFRVSQEEIRSTPGGTAVLFGSVAIPGTQDVLATDASFGVAILNEKQQQKQYAAAARLELPNQKATCWATISPLTNTAFVTDVGRNMLIEVGYNANANGNGNGEGGEQGELSLLNEIDLSSIGGPDLGLIDLRAAGEFVYALSPGAGTGEEAAINVIHAGTKQFVQNARLTGVGAGKNSMGMAVYV
ncbi:hypothetical protein QBC37DRAFT_304722 [Rhypophila decipiens]|uniref:3-carboxymuconate cyclase n=1 Tax=Rhypophila decipiens TaxID=261697 RepID=A0AAN7BF88_9PEZI|nr:hypothetical protein QBC37DRAFT_304722 [Rhypophila decipiens]